MSGRSVETTGALPVLVIALAIVSSAGLVAVAGASGSPTGVADGGVEDSGVSEAGVGLAGLSTATPAEPERPVAAGGTDGTEPGDEPAGTPDIDHALADGAGETQVLVHFESPDRGPGPTSIDALRANADRAQGPFLQRAEREPGFDVERSFWIANAALVTVDLDRVELEDLARIDGVTAVSENAVVSVPEPPGGAMEGDAERSALDGPDDSPSGHGDGGGDTAVGEASLPAESGNDDGYTDGLELIDVPAIREAYETRGEGTTVAVLDTGVDPDHPDIALHTEDPSDATHPGGWAEFDRDGERVNGSVPHDGHGHGTHVTGTATGGNASGTAIGVAPGATTAHGLVVPGGSGTMAQVLAGMEWAVADVEADIVSMSLGVVAYEPAYIEAVGNAEAAGTLVVAAAGNSREGTSASPANVYEATSVGAVDGDGTVAGFSSGELVNTSEAWGADADEDWPAEYVVPRVSAPGVAVFSAVPGGEYDSWSGTSMATPHVAGVAALLVSMDSSLAPNATRAALEAHAWKPEDWNERDAAAAIDGQDTRYGHGIVNASASMDAVAPDGGVEGVVTDETGAAIPGATVTVAERGYSASTAADGTFHLHAIPGNYTLEVAAFGHATETVVVTVPDEHTTVTANATLAPAPDIRVEDPLPDALESGHSAGVTVELANVELATVTDLGEYDPAEATMSLDGQHVALEETVNVSDGPVTLTVGTENGTVGTLAPTIEVGDSNETAAKTLGPTTVFDRERSVAVIDDGDYGEAVLARLEDALPPGYDLTLVDGPTGVALAEEQAVDAVVVQNVGVETAADLHAATDDRAVGAVWLDQWNFMSTESTAITNRSAAIGDPVAPGAEWLYGDATFSIDRAHPIFGGVGGYGEEFVLHDGADNDRAWFEDTDLAALGTVEDTPGDARPAAAVDDETRTVLLASWGSSAFVAPHEYTADAEAVLANAVAWSSDPVHPLEIEAPPPVHVREGTAVETALALENVTAMETRLRPDATLAADELTLAVDGEERAFGEEYDLDGPVSGTATVTVTADDGAAGSLTLEHRVVDDQGREHVLTTGPTAVYEPPLVVPDDVRTLEEAMAIVPDGETVLLDNGTHEATLDLVNHEGVTLAAAPNASPVVTPPTIGDLNSTIRLASENASLAGIHVEGPAAVGEDGPAISVDANATVEGGTVANASTGVQVEPAAHATVRNATIRDVDVGLQTRYDGVIGDPSLHATDNEVDADGSAIVLGQSGHPSVLDRNVVRAGDTGLSIAGTTASIEDNAIESAGVGVQIHAPRAGNVTGNVVAANEIALLVGEPRGSHVGIASLEGNDLSGGLEALRIEHHGGPGPAVRGANNSLVGPVGANVTAGAHPVSLFDDELRASERVAELHGGDILLANATATLEATGEPLSVGDDGANRSIDRTAVLAHNATVVDLDLTVDVTGAPLSSPDGTVRNVTVDAAATGVKLGPGAAIADSAITVRPTAVTVEAPNSTLERVTLGATATAVATGTPATNATSEPAGDGAPQVIDVQTTESAGAVTVAAPNATIRDSDLSGAQDRPVEAPSTLATSVTATHNYHGPLGPDGTTITDGVAYEPFVTAPPERVAAEPENRTAFGHHLELTAGKPTAVAVPTDQAVTLEEALWSVDGAVYALPDGYGVDESATEAGWQAVVEDTDAQDALSAYVIVPRENATVLVAPAGGSETDGTVGAMHETGTTSPTTVTLAEGWTLVGPPVYGAIEETVATRTNATVEYALRPHDGPGGQPTAVHDWETHAFGNGSADGEPVTASPFEGLLLWATEPGGLEPTIGTPIATGDYEPTLEFGNASTAPVESDPLDEAVPVPPPLPMAAAGTVTLDGEPAPAGTTVTALVDGTERATLTVTEEGALGDPAALGRALVIDGSAAEDGNASVAFRIDGEPATIESVAIAGVDDAGGDLTGSDGSTSASGGESTGAVEVTWLAGAVLTVDVAAETPTPVPPPPPPGEPAFEIVDVDAPATIQADERLTVTAEIRNLGDAAGETTVLAGLGPETETESVELPAGETETVTLELVVAVDPGDHAIVVNESATGAATELPIEVLGVTDDEPPADDREPDDGPRDDADGDLRDDDRDPVEDGGPTEDDRVPGFGLLLAALVAIGWASVRVLGRSSDGTGGDERR